MASLIPRFYELGSGRILLDGKDTRDYELNALRRQIALVSQQVTLFNDTLRNNIAWLVLFMLAVPLVIAYGVLVQIPLHLSTRRYLKEAHAKHGVLIETINVLEVIRSVGAERRMRQIWNDALRAAEG